MGAYFANSLKRQYAYSNSAAIRRLDKGKLQIIKARLEKSGKKTETRRAYPDKNGKIRYHGTKQLKKTETLDWNTLMQLFRSSPNVSRSLEYPCNYYKLIIVNIYYR